MNIQLLEVTTPSLAYLCLGGFVVVFSSVSLLIKEKIYISEVVLGAAFGVLMGPYVANVFNPRNWGGNENQITMEVMRVVLAMGLFAIGVELPQSYLAKHARGLLIMVVPTMAFGWLVIGAVIYVLFPPLNYTSSLAIAACLTPTDPVVSAAILGGKFAVKHVPKNLRQILAAESAVNDGMAYPFISIALYLTLDNSYGQAFGDWFLVGWLYQVILGTVMGAVIGWLFSKLMRISHRRGYIDHESYVAQYIALTLLTIGIASSLGSDDLLAAFAAGTAVSWDGYFNDQTENESFAAVIDLVLNCACFIYIGAWMPFNRFSVAELFITPWRLLVLFLSILALRRIPPLLILYSWVPEVKSWREALFSGHFGPMGVGAIFVSTLAKRRLPTPNYPPETQIDYLAASLQPIIAFVVLCSIIIHGLSIPFFSLGKRTLTLTRSVSRNPTSNANTAEWILGTKTAPSKDMAQIPTHPETVAYIAERGESKQGIERERISEQRVTVGDIESTTFVDRGKQRAEITTGQAKDMENAGMNIRPQSDNLMANAPGTTQGYGVRFPAAE